MVLIDMLNENQKKAVLTSSQYVRIIAGAGSGKTRVLTMRIAHLIEQCHVWPNKILAITFTNKAANEMKERIRQMLPEQGNAVFISTIHSLCVRILREDIPAMGMPRNFTVMDADDQRSILKEAYKEFGLDKQTYTFGSLLDYITKPLRSARSGPMCSPAICAGKTTKRRFMNITSTVSRRSTRWTSTICFCIPCGCSASLRKFRPSGCSVSIISTSTSSRISTRSSTI